MSASVNASRRDHDVDGTDSTYRGFEASFDRCVEQGIHEEAIRANKAIGLELLVRGTPTFFLGYPVGDGTRVSLVRRINGAQSLDVFQREIDGALAKVP